MPNFIRWREEGATFFFTVVTHRRRPILTAPLGRECFRHALITIRAKLPFEMHACVLLPDHVHCIWQLPENDDAFSRRWRQIKEAFTRRYLSRGGVGSQGSTSQKAEGRRGIWQPRFWEHRIRDETDYFRHRDYIHLNPVHHGHVANPGDWPWSSFHRHVKAGWLDANWPGTSPVELPTIPE